jgi:hypothetical protein
VAGDEPIDFRAGSVEDGGMASLNVNRSIRIRATADRVFEAVRDFRGWPRWSPWLICEPECRVTYAEDGTSYRWEGRVVGSGEISRTSEDAPRSLGFRLVFEKPFRSASEVGFRFEDRGDGTTEVTWTMDGALPWFLFWMARPMAAFLGMDYERGLAMLREIMETGEVPSRLEFLGTGVHPGGGYVGVRTRSAIADIGPAMEAAFARLEAGMAERDLRPTGKAFTLYHRWDVVNGTAESTAAYPVDGRVEGWAEDGRVSGHLPAVETDRIRHTGPYRFLGNAWSAAMARAQAGVIRRRGRPDPFEVYETAPGEPGLPVTTVHVPVRKGK